MGLSAGIVGLPNVGKSTIFNALSAAGAESANYPFSTIEPNTGIVTVPDERLAIIESYIPTKSVVPAVIEILDIAGLVEGASQGEGLGNQFLGHIRQVDAILHVVRAFEDDDAIHVSGIVDPLRDIEIINLELILADLESATRQLDRNIRAAKAKDPDAMRRVAALEPIIAALEAERPARVAIAEMGPATRQMAESLGFITSKPVLYVANVDETNPTGEGNPHVERIRGWVEAHGDRMIVLSGAIEAEIATLDNDQERTLFLEDIGLAESGLAKLARTTYQLLGLHSFFTAGPKEIRAWTIPQGAKAPQAAGEIHSDFERGFIRAESYAFADLEQYGSESAIRAAGKMRSEGREYVVQDGDIIKFLFNV